MIGPMIKDPVFEDTDITTTSFSKTKIIVYKYVVIPFRDLLFFLYLCLNEPLLMAVLTIIDSLFSEAKCGSSSIYFHPMQQRIF